MAGQNPPSPAARMELACNYHTFVETGLESSILESKFFKKINAQTGQNEGALNPKKAGKKDQQIWNDFVEKRTEFVEWYNKCATEKPIIPALALDIICWVIRELWPDMYPPPTKLFNVHQPQTDFSKPEEAGSTRGRKGDAMEDKLEFVLDKIRQGTTKDLEWPNKMYHIGAIEPYMVDPDSMPKQLNETIFILQTAATVRRSRRDAWKALVTNPWYDNEAKHPQKWAVTERLAVIYDERLRNQLYACGIESADYKDIAFLGIDSHIAKYFAKESQSIATGGSARHWPLNVSSSSTLPAKSKSKGKSSLANPGTDGKVGSGKIGKSGFKQQARFTRKDLAEQWRWIVAQDPDGQLKLSDKPEYAMYYSNTNDDEEVDGGSEQESTHDQTGELKDMDTGNFEGSVDEEEMKSGSEQESTHDQTGELKDPDTGNFEGSVDEEEMKSGSEQESTHHQPGELKDMDTEKFGGPVDTENMGTRTQEESALLLSGELGEEDVNQWEGTVEAIDIDYGRTLLVKR